MWKKLLICSKKTEPQKASRPSYGYHVIYNRVRKYFDDGLYEAAIAEFDKAEGEGALGIWESSYCQLYCALAYAHNNNYGPAVTRFKHYLETVPRLRPQQAIQKAGPAFIERLKLGKPAGWLELWNQFRHQASPIEALVEDLWNPDLPQSSDRAREPIYEALKKYGADAIPPLLHALELNDYNDASREQEMPYPKRALVNIGDPAFEVLVKAIFTPHGGRVSRAAVKMLWMFGAERAEPVLRKALNDSSLGYKPYIVEELESIERRKERGLH